eukprot:GHVR01109857.1.p1 GENE.GHVR01109857.1~~GHVR01109857.1.p1  ORF type:complete len:186 (+),score=22.41 GHVR01109857.1:458-1015(+)
MENSKGVHEDSDCSGYVYCPPTTSPFYRKAVSPLCDRLCSHLPLWVHPDWLTLLGTVCAFASALCVGCSCFLSGALLWQLYAVLDNMDGKQARRLKLSSFGGEFLDHSCDALVAGVAYCVWTGAVLGDDVMLWGRHLFLFSFLLPNYIGNWAHKHIGTLSIGASQYFTFILSPRSMVAPVKCNMG